MHPYFGKRRFHPGMMYDRGLTNSMTHCDISIQKNRGLRKQKKSKVSNLEERRKCQVVKERFLEVKNKDQILTKSRDSLELSEST